MTRAIALLREPRIDQYGIRCVLQVEGAPIKFELIYEGRVQLDDPPPEDRICGAGVLARQDKVATELMANSDRWADASVMSRDVIDLAMLAGAGGALDPAGVAKAVRAYGQSALIDLRKAVGHLLADEQRLPHCMKKLSVRLPEDILRRRLLALHAE